MNYWIVKSEPEACSWSQLVKDGKIVLPPGMVKK
jgi:predicted RNA-binding protein with PUA-like domain